MSTCWDTKLQLTSSAPERAEASALVRDDSPFFDGHFPDHPVVPGIALLSLVEQAVALTTGSPQVTGFRRVRFRLAVEQGGEFTITLRESPRFPGERLIFEVRYGGDRACDGQVTVQPGGEA